MGDRNVEVVEKLWITFRRRGLEAVLELVDPDVEWVLHEARGRVFHGREGLREHFRALAERDETVEAMPARYQSEGDCVLVSGRLRTREPQGVVDQDMHWLYTIRDGRVARVEAFSDEPSARAAMATLCEGRPVA